MVPEVEVGIVNMPSSSELTETTNFFGVLTKYRESLEVHMLPVAWTS